MVYNPKYLSKIKEAQTREKEVKAEQGLIRVAPYAWVKKEFKEKFFEDFKEFKKKYI